MNRLYWQIGKRLFKMKDKCSNPCEYISDYYSYYYGNSYRFNRENIYNMKKFYLCFPIYFKSYDRLTWDHFKLLTHIDNYHIRNFYLLITLFCDSSVEELKSIIRSSIYQRI